MTLNLEHVTLKQQHKFLVLFDIQTLLSCCVTEQ